MTVPAQTSRFCPIGTSSFLLPSCALTTVQTHVCLLFVCLFCTFVTLQWVFSCFYLCSSWDCSSAETKLMSVVFQVMFESISLSMLWLAQFLLKLCFLITPLSFVLLWKLHLTAFLSMTPCSYSLLQQTGTFNLFPINWFIFFNYYFSNSCSYFVACLSICFAFGRYSSVNENPRSEFSIVLYVPSA